MIKKCGYCNKEFWAVHSYNKNCSQECGYESRRGGLTYTCGICKIQFYSKKPRKYCSTKCFGESNVKDKVECTCKTCGKIFHKFPCDIPLGRGNFCSIECRAKNYSGERHHNWKGGISPQVEKDRKAAGSKPWRNACLKRDNYQCVQCGSTEHLEVDHIMPWALFPRLRFEVSNGRTLCHDCHVKTPTYGAKTK
jgi:HNH endonuclease